MSFSDGLKESYEQAQTTSQIMIEYVHEEVRSSGTKDNLMF